jgi:hypothetical protein
MRRVMTITTFALFLAVPLWAQRGGGHGGFSGGHASGFGGHAGFSGRAVVGGSHFSGGMRSGAGFSRGPIRTSHLGSSRGPFLHDGFRGDRFRGGRFRGGFDHRFHDRDRRFRNHCFGFGCFGYPWIYGGYYDPFWWGDSSSSYDQDYEQNLAIANEMNEQSLREQQMRRQEEVDGDRDSYARSDPAPRPASGSEPKGMAIMPATVLVFHDQRQKEIQNYAIVGQTLWNFAPGHTEKIPLSDLDLAATTKANDDRGVTFRVPSSNEAQ